MKNIILTTLLTLISSCTTVEFVRKDLTPEKKGVLRYAPPSDTKQELKYKAEVNKKATEFCGTDYKITREYQALDESDSSVGVGTGFGFGASNTMIIGGSRPTRSMANFVEFSCEASATPLKNVH